MIAYGLINKSSKITIKVEMYRSDALKNEKVTLYFFQFVQVMLRKINYNNNCYRSFFIS